MAEFSTGSTDNLLLPLRLCGVAESLRIPQDSETIALLKSFEKELKIALIKKPCLAYTFIEQSPTPCALAATYLKWLSLRMRKKSLSYNTRLEEIRCKFLANVIRENEISCSNLKVCVITHDVDTERGFRRSLRLKEIERKYDVSSTWFIPSNQYELDKTIIKKLSDGSEIASHDVKHDGRLILLSRKDKIKRLKQSKEALETVLGREVIGFRAPFLQYNLELMEAVAEAGYVYDSSAPTWEPVIHPTSMKPDGLTLIDPLRINNLIELPLSLPQDHLMISYLGLSIKQTCKVWLDLIRENSFSSTSIFLVHPDYDFASQEGLEFYNNLIETLIDKRFLILNAGELAKRVQSINQYECSWLVQA